MMARRVIQSKSTPTTVVELPESVVELPESEGDRWWSAWVWGWLAATITLTLWAALAATVLWISGQGFNILTPWPIAAAGLVLTVGVGVLAARRAWRGHTSHRAELSEEDMSRALSEISSQMDARLKESGK